MADDVKTPVKLYVYDISKGMARSLSMAFLGKQLDGIWHTGIMVYGQEFYFGGTGGIECCPPGGTILGQPDSIVDLGNTEIPYEMFLGYLNELSQNSYRPVKYHLLDHNCNTFSAEVAQFLTGNSIPTHITSLPAEVMSTPLGQMIRPMIDAMSLQPSGGHAVFPEAGSTSQGNQEKESASEPENKNKSMPEKRGSSGEVKQSSQPESAWDKAVQDEWEEPPEEDDQKLPPINYKDKPMERKEFHDLVYDKLPMRDLGLVSDIYDYLSEGENPSWSLGKDHIQTLHTVIGNGKIKEEARACVCIILQLLVLKKDFIVVLEREPTHLVQQIMEHFDQIPETVQVEFIKMLTNCASLEDGHRFLTHHSNTSDGDETFVTTQASSSQSDVDMLTWTIKLCVNCMLKDNQDINMYGSALVYNLSKFKLDEDTQVEIGSAILECLQREIKEETAHNCLSSLVQMMETNTELCDLAGVVGLNCSLHKKLSPRVRNLCEKAQQMSAL